MRSEVRVLYRPQRAFDQEERKRFPVHPSTSDVQATSGHYALAYSHGNRRCETASLGDIRPWSNIVEGGNAHSVSDLAPKIIELEPCEAITVRGDVVLADLPKFFERAFHEAAEAATASGVEIVGPPFCFYPEMPTETVAVEAGFPVSSRAEPRGNAHPFVLPGGRAVQAMHIGTYESMEQTYAKLQSWMSERNIQPAGGMWECYLSDPAIEVDPARWRTMIVCPIA